jgi:amino acid transporter
MTLHTDASSLETAPSAEEAAQQGAHGRPERLKRGQLGLPGVVASTLANIAPAMSFYFGFSLIAYTAGVASPLTIIAAAIAVIFVANTLAEFSKMTPSTGSWVSFIGKGLGPFAATVTAVTYMLGLMPGSASLMGIQGGWLSILLQQYCHVHVPWQLLSVLLAAIVFILVARGVSLSTKAAGALFAFETAILILVSVWVMVVDRSHLTLAPFEPSHLASGWKGLGLGFPLAIYMFIGWENSAALAEETHQPRKNVPKAIFGSIAFMVIFYLFLAYATVVGANYNVNTLANASVPFITVAQPILGGAVVIAYIAGFTSIMSSVIAAVNGQARVLFSAGREGMLPSFLGRVAPKHRTPMFALGAYLLVGTVICLWWGWSMNTVTFYDESASLCVIPGVLIYVAVNVALVAYTWRRPDRSVFRHVVLPLLGIAAIAFPLYELVKPGQPTPYDLFPYVTAAFIAVAIVRALWLRRRDPGLAERVGSLVADAE